MESGRVREKTLFRELPEGAENVLSYESQGEPKDEELEAVFAEIKAV